MTAQMAEATPRVPEGVDPRILDGTPGRVDEMGLRVGSPANVTPLENEPVPLPVHTDDTIVLGGGVPFPDGRLLTEAVVRELNGADEEALSRVSIATNPVRFIDTVVHRCLVSVGGQELTPEQIDAMLIGDRDSIVLAVRRATYGDKIKLDNLKCPSCGYGFAVHYSLTDDVPKRELANAGLRTRTVPLTGKHGEAEVLLIDGNIQKAVFADDVAGVNDAELNTRLLRNAVQKIDGVPVMQVEQVREGLSAVNRKRILDYLTDNQPGPRYEEVTQSCPSCNASAPLVLGLADLFRGE